MHYHKSYPGGLSKWVTDYEAAFEELSAILKVKAWSNDDAKKERILLNAGALNLSWLDHQSKHMTFRDVCNALRKLSLSQEHQAQHKSNIKARLVEAFSYDENEYNYPNINLEWINKGLWDQLPPDIKDLIIQTRRQLRIDASKENNNKSKEKKVDNNKTGQIPTTSQAKIELKSQYTKAKLAAAVPDKDIAEAIMENLTEGELSRIDEYISQNIDEGSSDDSTEVTGNN